MPPGNPEALAERLAYLYGHPKLLEVLGRQGHRRAIDLFNWQRVTKSIAALYEEVLASRGRGRDDGRLLGIVEGGFQEAKAALEHASRLMPAPILDAADVLATCLRAGGKIMVCGNGGSAADGQHFVGELVGKFKRENRPGLAALALRGDSPQGPGAWPKLPRDWPAGDGSNRPPSATSLPAHAPQNCQTDARCAHRKRRPERG